MKRIFYCLLMVFCSHLAFGQDSLLVRQDTFPSAIQAEYLENSIKFKPIIRPLVPIPGGREAYYTYLWDFGDGQFSTQESPEHQYESPGEFDVSLYIVNNYDNGPRPKKPKTKVKVESKLAHSSRKPNAFETSFFKSNDVFQLFKNANAVPGEDMSLVVGVRPRAAKGKILLLTNEKLINPNGFLVANQSRYHQENILPVGRRDQLDALWANVTQTAITQSGSPDYGDYEELNFTGNEANRFFNSLLDEYNTVTQYEITDETGDTQFSLINFDITPEMLADTNAIVTVTGIYLAEGGNPVVHKLDIPIIKSHDPNKMSVKPARANYRMQFKKKKLTYKVQFQNDGEGDARDIRLEMSFPEQLDVNSFQLLNLYPSCDTCLTNQDLGCYTYEIKEDNRINFNFRGIALPGTASPTITDQDSTKGFIRFTLQSHKKLQNKSLPSFTNIYFDKNEPIRTNTSTVRFRPGLSPLVTLGLNAPSKHPNDDIGKLTNGLTIGVGIAPLAPYKRPYWQVELFASTFGTDYSRSFTNLKAEIPLPNDRGDVTYYTYTQLDSAVSKKYLSLQVPVQIRYNISRYLSAGVGAILKTDLNTKYSEQLTYHLYTGTETARLHTADIPTEKEKRSTLRFAPLVDLNIGRAYLGPALGVRYHFDKTYKSNLNLYLMWRL